MSTTSNDARKRMRRNTFLFSLAITIIVSTLLYFEQVAILFILATLALSIFLAVVGLADLRGNELALSEQKNAPEETTLTATDGKETSANKRQPRRTGQAIENVRGE